MSAPRAMWSKKLASLGFASMMPFLPQSHTLGCAQIASKFVAEKKRYREYVLFWVL
jgi:hypothetical protein